MALVVGAALCAPATAFAAGATATPDDPRVSYTSPFTTNGTRPPDEVTVDRARIRLAATLDGVAHVTVTRRYRYAFAGEAEVARDAHRLDDPGGQFSQPLLLGAGENEVRVRLRDDRGRVRVHETTLVVADDRAPTIAVEAVERTGDGVRVAGVVRDAVKVNSLAVRAPGSRGARVVVTPTDAEPTAARLAVPFETTVPAAEEVVRVVLVADDVAGNERTATVPVGYGEGVDPEIAVESVAPVDGGDAVRVRATVAGGAVTRVAVETVADGIVELATVYDGPATERVVVDERLRAAGPDTRVRVRATDASLDEHVRTVAVGPAETATPTAVETPRPTPATTATGTGPETETPTAGDGAGVGVVGAAVAALCWGALAARRR